MVMDGGTCKRAEMKQCNYLCAVNYLYLLFYIP